MLYWNEQKIHKCGIRAFSILAFRQHFQLWFPRAVKSSAHLNTSPLLCTGEERRFGATYLAKDVRSHGEEVNKTNNTFRRTRTEAWKYSHVVVFEALLTQNK
jgi:hypothetical protein